MGMQQQEISGTVSALDSNVQTSKTGLLIVATVATFMGPFMVSGVNIVLPAMEAEFSIGAVLLSWIANTYLLSSAVLLMPMAKIADMVGRKKIFVAGLWLFSLATLLITVAPSIWILLGFRVLQGAGAAMVSTTGIAIVASVFPVSERGRAIGIVVAAVYIGLSIGPFAAGYLSVMWGWRSIFLVAFPFGLISAVLAMVNIKDEWADARGQALDITGILFYALALICFMLGLSTMPGRLPGVSLATGIMIFILFVRQEMRTRYPVVEINLFRHNRRFSFSSLAALINYAATFAIAFYMSLYLQYIKGIPPQNAGLILVTQPVMMALFSPLAGRLSDRFEASYIASTGMALCAAGLFCLAFLHQATPVAIIVAILVVVGIGFALFSSPNMNAIMGSVTQRHYGLASGTVATMRLVGQMSSMAIATMFFAIFIGNVGITPANQDRLLISTHAGFATFCALCTIGIFFSLSRGKTRAAEKI
ncbi:MAG: MFS transporter [Thermodesulfobacteriota bacterium]|nr:MFS transporter [Thermodesulfobacteriota bacterium]